MARTMVILLLGFLFTTFPVAETGIGFPFHCTVIGCGYCGTPRMQQVCSGFCNQCNQINPRGLEGRDPSEQRSFRSRVGTRFPVTKTTQPTTTSTTTTATTRIFYPGTTKTIQRKRIRRPETASPRKALPEWQRLTLQRKVDQSPPEVEDPETEYEYTDSYGGFGGQLFGATFLSELPENVPLLGEAPLKLKPNHYENEAKLSPLTRGQIKQPALKLPPDKPRTQQRWRGPSVINSNSRWGLTETFSETRPLNRLSRPFSYQNSGLAAQRKRTRYPFPQGTGNTGPKVIRRVKAPDNWPRHGLPDTWPSLHGFRGGRGPLAPRRINYSKIARPESPFRRRTVSIGRGFNNNRYRIPQIRRSRIFSRFGPIRLSPNRRYIKPNRPQEQFKLNNNRERLRNGRYTRIRRPIPPVPIKASSRANEARRSFKIQQWLNSRSQSSPRSNIRVRTKTTTEVTPFRIVPPQRLSKPARHFLYRKSPFDERTEEATCPKPDWSPCVSKKKADARFKTCCTEENLPSGCHTICRYGVQRPELEKVFMWQRTCPIANIPHFMYCASGGADAAPCCAHKGVLSGDRKLCRPFCNPAQGVPAFHLGYLKCLNQLDTIMTCYHASLTP